MRIVCIMLCQLRGELLLNPKNAKVTLKYASDVQNLILMMNLLKDDYSNIQQEAFIVFKVRLAEICVAQISQWLMNEVSCVVSRL